MKKVKLSNNTEILIDDDEFSGVSKGVSQKDTLVVIRRGAFNSSYFVAIVDADDDEKKNRNEGTLHDGLPVIRYFGSWYQDGEFDEKGKPTRRIDPEFYPEVLQDCVPTRKEFEQKYRALPKEERLKLIVGDIKKSRISGLKKIGGLLEGSFKKLTHTGKT